MAGIVQEPNGRWRWCDATQLGGMLRSFNRSIVSFDSREAALADLAGHEAATTDETGRLVRSAQDLRRLIGAALAMRDECRGVDVDCIEHHRPSRDGCNWHVPLTAQDGAAPCARAIAEQLGLLRKIYNLPGGAVKRLPAREAEAALA